MSTSLFLTCEPPMRVVHESIRISSTFASTASSYPLLSTRARLTHCEPALVPNDGGSGCWNSSFFAILAKYVNSQFTRSCNMPRSKPASNSVATSGLRFRLPSWFSTRPGFSPPALGYVSALRKVIAAVVPGGSPALPNDPRTRKRSLNVVFGNHDSSDITYDTFADG